MCVVARALLPGAALVLFCAPGGLVPKDGGPCGRALCPCFPPAPKVEKAPQMEEESGCPHCRSRRPKPPRFFLSAKQRLAYFPVIFQATAPEEPVRIHEAPRNTEPSGEAFAGSPEGPSPPYDPPPPRSPGVLQYN